ncbi:1-phosphofructokinase [Rhodobacteraceae bacterium DSL-40]|uniref:1-phosphofructokinase n=1 Tax=Amaricoccus sp. B4 TaxID=3368557 RepID=UPI000DAC8044
MSGKPRIATVSLNSAVDQTVTVRGFAVDTVNRVSEARVDAGGKGVNVASFLAHFGHEVVVTGLLGRDNEALFAQHFEAAGVVDACLRVAGATRTNVKIVDPDNNTVTDLNFPGIRTADADLAAIRERLEVVAAGGIDWLVLAGSLPEGMPVTAYADLIAWAKGRGIRVALDTSGAPFGPAVLAGPDIIKPNIAELRELTSQPLEDHDAVIAAARRLNARGISMVAVSMGAEGAILVTPEAAVLARPPRVPVASTVGAGDAMVAGLVHAATLGLPLAEAAPLATAFSLGALGEIGPRLPETAKIEALARQVGVTELCEPAKSPRTEETQ